MTKAKTIRWWALVALAGLGLGTSMGCGTKSSNYPTQPPARDVEPVETTFVDAAFQAQVDTSGAFLLTVIFTDLSTGNIEKWSWDFGDGSKSSQQNPVKTYKSEGTYVVTLTVSNSISSDSTSQFVAVGEPPEEESPEEGESEEGSGESASGD
jgi:PKD repeat protein